MKKLFLCLLALGALASCDYDDTALQDRVDAVEEQLTALEAIVKACEAKKTIDAVNTVTNGTEIVFSDGSKVVITNGADGSSYITNVENTGTEVVFTYDGGKTISIPLTNPLGLTFSKENFLIAEGETIEFQIVGGTAETRVGVITSGSVSASVVKNADNKGGVITINSISNDAAPSLTAWVSNSERTLLYYLTLEGVEHNVSKEHQSFNLGSGAGSFVVTVEANAEYSFEIPAEATWITKGDARAMKTEDTTFNVAANTEYPRSAEIALKYGEKTVATIKVSQAGEKVAPNTLVVGATVFELKSVVEEDLSGDIMIRFAEGENVDFDNIYSYEDGYGYAVCQSVFDTEIDMMENSSWYVMLSQFDGVDISYIEGYYADSAKAKLTKDGDNNVYTLDAVVEGVSVKMNLTYKAYVAPAVDYNIDGVGTAVVMEDQGFANGWHYIYLSPKSYDSFDQMLESEDWYWLLRVNESIMDGQARDLTTLAAMDLNTFKGDLYQLLVEDQDNYGAPNWMPEGGSEGVSGSLTLNLDKSEQYLTVVLNAIIDGKEYSVQFWGNYLDPLAGGGGDDEKPNYTLVSGIDEGVYMKSALHEDGGTSFGEGMHVFCFSPVAGLTKMADYTEGSILYDANGMASYGIQVICKTSTFMSLDGTDVTLNAENANDIYAISVVTGDGGALYYRPNSGTIAGTISIKEVLNGEPIFKMSVLLNDETNVEVYCDFSKVDVGTGGGANGEGSLMFGDDLELPLVAAYTDQMGDVNSGFEGMTVHLSPSSVNSMSDLEAANPVTMKLTHEALEAAMGDTVDTSNYEGCVVWYNGVEYYGDLTVNGFGMDPMTMAFNIDLMFVGGGGELIVEFAGATTDVMNFTGGDDSVPTPVGDGMLLLGEDGDDGRFMLKAAYSNMSDFDYLELYITPNAVSTTDEIIMANPVWVKIPYTVIDTKLTQPVNTTEAGVIVAYDLMNDDGGTYYDGQFVVGEYSDGMIALQFQSTDGTMMFSYAGTFVDVSQLSSPGIGWPTAAK